MMEKGGIEMNNSGIKVDDGIEVDGDEISTTNGSTDMGNGLVGMENGGIYMNDVDNIDEELEQKLEEKWQQGKKVGYQKGWNDGWTEGQVNSNNKIQINFFTHSNFFISSNY